MIRPVLKQTLPTAVQWRTAPSGRGAPTHEEGGGERAGEGATEPPGVRAGDDPSGLDLLVNEKDFDLDLGGYVTKRAIVYTYPINSQ